MILEDETVLIPETDKIQDNTMTGSRICGVKGPISLHTHTHFPKYSVDVVLSRPVTRPRHQGSYSTATRTGVSARFEFDCPVMSKLTILQVIEQFQECLGGRYISILHSFLGREGFVANLKLPERELYLELEQLKPRAQFYGAETELNKLIAKIPDDSMLHVAVHELVLTNSFNGRVNEILQDLDRIEWASASSRVEVSVLSSTQGLSEWEITVSDGVQKLKHPVLHQALQHLAQKHNRKWVVKATLVDDEREMGPFEQHTLESWTQDEQLDSSKEKLLFTNDMFLHVL